MKPKLRRPKVVEIAKPIRSAGEGGKPGAKPTRPLMDIGDCEIISIMSDHYISLTPVEEIAKRHRIDVRTITKIITGQMDRKISHWWLKRYRPKVYEKIEGKFLRKAERRSGAVGTKEKKVSPLAGRLIRPLLDEDRVLEILKDVYHSGMSMMDTATKYNVTYMCVYSVCTARTWKDITAPWLMENDLAHRVFDSNRIGK